MKTITIHNLKLEKPIEPYDFYVDRRSPIGNPFNMQTERDRESVCSMYIDYFNNMISCQSHEFVQYLHLLKLAYKQHGKLRLFCWCAPKRCHAETIKEWIENEL